MKTSMLKMACILLLPLLPLVQPTPLTATPPPCPVPNVSFSWDDYGWTTNGCTHDGLKERFVTVSNASPSQCIELEMKVEDVNDYGTSSSTHWQMLCWNTRTYVGQDQEQWNDGNCNGQVDFGEYSTHTYSWTGNYRCP